MLAIEVRLTQGRFHATPWGRHVNEGVPEWPPSPWRLLRALCSSWLSLGEPEGFAQLVSELAREAPLFHLPAHGVGHLRRYLPVGEKRRLGLDSFVSVEEPMLFLWPELQLGAEQLTLLDELLEGLPYFGRSESLARLRRGEAAAATARPLLPQEQCDAVVPVFCPLPSVRVEQLMMGTGQMRRERRNRPAGSTWLLYRWLEPGATPSPAERERLLIYRLRGRVPRWEEALSLADKVRRAILKLGDVSAAVLGKVEGQARTDGHRHLHLLPDGEASSRSPSRLLLWAAEGFAPADLALLSTLRWVDGIELVPDDGLAGWEERGRVWRSLTPFLCSRHPRRGRDEAEEQLLRECALRGLPEPHVELLPGEGRKFLVRRGSKDGPPGPLSWFRLTFPQELEGPLCLGASCHFGMGRFVPEQEG